MKPDLNIGTSGKLRKNGETERCTCKNKQASLSRRTQKERTSRLRTSGTEVRKGKKGRKPGGTLTPGVPKLNHMGKKFGENEGRKINGKNGQKISLKCFNKGMLPFLGERKEWKGETGVRQGLTFTGGERGLFSRK